jgi:hypothetical protein
MRGFLILLLLSSFRAQDEDNSVRGWWRKAAGKVLEEVEKVEGKIETDVSKTISASSK